MLKLIKTFNKVPKQDIIFDHDKCKKLHKELFNKVLIELLYTKSAGHKDSSANINKAHANNVKHANSLLHNHITYFFNKIKKIERTLSEHNKHILTSLSKKYSDNRVKLNEFKKVNNKLNLLREGICLFIFNRKIKKEIIIQNVNVLSNIIEHTALIVNKRVCLGNIHEYLYENINDIHDNIKNKKNEKVLADLLLIQKHTFIPINRMRRYNENRKIATVNEKINNNTKKSYMNSTTKKSNKYANIKITNANNANNKITNANEKNTNANNTNKKITYANNANNANKEISDANNANEKRINGNSANNNSANNIKKSSITIRLKRPHVIY